MIFYVFAFAAVLAVGIVTLVRRTDSAERWSNALRWAELNHPPEARLVDGISDVEPTITVMAVTSTRSDR